MQTAEHEILENDYNPLDSVEFVLSANHWQFERISLEELVLNVNGKSAQYRLFFLWEENLKALQFCVQYDTSIENHNRTNAYKAIATINEELWMGHFDLPKETNSPTYRYTTLIRTHNTESLMETIEDMIDISLAQCERYASAFMLLMSANDLDSPALELALMDTKGES